jgi:hypothetical protein
MSKPVLQVELQHLLDTAPLRDELEIMESVCPDLEFTYLGNSRRELSQLMQNAEDKDKITAHFELLAYLLQITDNVPDLAQKIDEVYNAELAQYEENMQAVFEQTKPFERTARSLSLLYQNATYDVPIYIMPVSRDRFADAANPRHFDLFQHFLRQQFYKWKMQNSPFYISYIGDIGSKSAMDKMATIAQETRALAVLDIAEKNTFQEVLKYADRLGITGIPAHLAHLVVIGTWVNAYKAFDVAFSRDEKGRLCRKETQMSVPTAGAFIGKMLNVAPGEFITGMENAPFVGINGVKVKYDLERIDAKTWEDLGLIQISTEGHIQGATTANKSNNYDLRKFPKVDVANALLKDLIQFCNIKSFSKWGERQKRIFQREIEVYLNNRVIKGLIEGYSINLIRYDEYDENVEIDITVRFFEIADKFEINLHGPKNIVNLLDKGAEKNK